MASAVTTVYRKVEVPGEGTQIQILTHRGWRSLFRPFDSKMELLRLEHDLQRRGYWIDAHGPLMLQPPEPFTRCGLLVQVYGLITSCGLVRGHAGECMGQ